MVRFVKKFLGLREKLDGLLDEKIQILTHKDLTNAKAEAHQAVNRANSLIAAMLLVGIVFGILASVITARSITRPVNQLVAATEAVAKGDLSRRVEIESNDELRDLGESFNRMTEDLERTTVKATDLTKAFEKLDVTHRELKSTQLQLVQAAKLAGLGELGAGIAHELNQPITTIQGFTQRIKRDGGRQIKDHADELDLIINASYRMARIVDNIRLFSRQSDFKPQLIDPLAPRDDALMLINEQLRLHGIEVERPAGDSLPRVMGDQVKLQQVFSNLIMNARDSLDTLPKDRPRRLVLGVRAEGDRVVYSVEDNGPGISEEDQARIFDPFFTTKEVGKGTGLGLSISHGILGDHGGEIRYEPAEGGGARFLVSLPIAPMEATGAVEGQEQEGRKDVG